MSDKIFPQTNFNPLSKEIDAHSQVPNMKHPLEALPVKARTQKIEEKPSTPQKYLSSHSAFETHYSSSTTTRVRTNKFLKTIKNFFGKNVDALMQSNERKWPEVSDLSQNTTRFLMNSREIAADETNSKSDFKQDVWKTYRSMESSPFLEKEGKEISTEKSGASNKVLRFTWNREAFEREGSSSEPASKEEVKEIRKKETLTDYYKKHTIQEILKENLQKGAIREEAKSLKKLKKQSEVLHYHMELQNKSNKEWKSLRESSKQLLDILDDFKNEKAKGKDNNIPSLNRSPDQGSPRSPRKSPNVVSRRFTKQQSIKMFKNNADNRRGGAMEEENADNKTISYESEKQTLLLAREEKEIELVCQEVLENIETLKDFIKSEKNLVKQLIILIGPHFNIYNILLSPGRNELHAELGLSHLKESMYFREAVYDASGTLTHKLKVNKQLLISLSVFCEHLQEFNFKKKQDEVHKRVANIPELFTSAIQSQYKLLNATRRKNYAKIKNIEQLDLRVESINVNRSLLDDLEKFELKSGPLPLIKQDVRNMGRCVEDSIKSLQKELFSIKQRLKE